MKNVSITQQIFAAVESNPTAIRSLAEAVARGDASAVRSTLGACGVEMSEGDANAILHAARSGALGAAGTGTSTTTSTTT